MSNDDPSGPIPAERLRREQHERFAYAIVKATSMGPCPWCSKHHGKHHGGGATPDCAIVFEARTALMLKR